MKENLADMETAYCELVFIHIGTAGYSALRGLYRYNDMHNNAHSGICLIPHIIGSIDFAV